jgi:hypothetical protein
MEALRKTGKFRFVVVKLSAAVELPPLVQKDVYVDFSAHSADHDHSFRSIVITSAA